jgi:hypothetical protein
MLVYDSFKGHLVEPVKDKFHESGIHLAVIPGGLTSVCQPLDVSINKPFKDALRREWHAWMAGGGAGETASGNLRRASFSDVCLWIKRAWEGISAEIICESFKKCKISNDLDSDLEVSDDSFSDNSDDDDVDDDDGDDRDFDDDHINDDDEIIDENDEDDEDDDDYISDGDFIIGE